MAVTHRNLILILFQRVVRASNMIAEVFILLTLKNEDVSQNATLGKFRMFFPFRDTLRYAFAVCSRAVSEELFMIFSSL